MIPKEIDREHILQAMEAVRADGVPSNRNSRKYDISFEECTYPPKYVICLASKEVLGRELRPQEFNGGEEANGFLRMRGFRIVDKRGEEVVAP